MYILEGHQKWVFITVLFRKLKKLIIFKVLHHGSQLNKTFWKTKNRSWKEGSSIQDMKPVSCLTRVTILTSQQ